MTMLVTTLLANVIFLDFWAASGLFWNGFGRLHALQHTKSAFTDQRTLNSQDITSLYPIIATQGMLVLKRLDSLKMQWLYLFPPNCNTWAVDKYEQSKTIVSAQTSISFLYIFGMER